MAAKSFDTPDEFSAKIDHLLQNVGASIAKDIESGHYAAMKEPEITTEIYNRYSGLFVPHGCIEAPKSKYRELFVSHNALIDAEHKESRKSLREHKRVWFFRTLTALTIAVIAVLAALLAKRLGIEMPTKLF